MTVNDLRVLVSNLDEYIHIPGGIERLKKTVLHLAVSGQLVPQDPSEGTGEDLYRQIQVEKTKLVASGKIKKQNSLSQLTEDEIPYSVPAGWRWTRLNDVIDVRDGTHDTPGATTGSNSYPLITSKNFVNGKIDFTTAKLISERDYIEISKRSHVDKYDILFSMIGGNIGNQIIVLEDNKFAVKNVALFKYYDRSLVLPFYLKIYTTNLANNLQSEATGGAQPFVSLNYLRSLPFALPPTAEQKRIVERTDEIFALIYELEAKYKTEEVERSKLVKSSLRALSLNGSRLALDNMTSIIKTKADAAELRKAILHLSVSGQLVPQIEDEGTGKDLYIQIQSANPSNKKSFSPIKDDEIPFTIPLTWKWVRLGEMSDIFNGNSINASEKTLKYAKVTNGRPYLGTKDVGYGYEKIDYDNGVQIPHDEPKFKFIPAGTTLICSEGGSAGKKCGIVDREVAFGNKMYAFKAYSDSVVPEFILNNYLTDYFYEQFKDKMTGIIGGISTNSFKELLLPLPPLAEQKRIVAKASELLALVAELEKHLEK